MQKHCQAIKKDIRLDLQEQVKLNPVNDLRSSAHTVH